MALDVQTLPSGTRRPLLGPFTRWPRAADTVLAIVLFLVPVFVVDDSSDDLVTRAVRDVPIVAVLLFAVAGGALIWRRSQPLVVLGVTLAAVTLSSALGYGDNVGFTMLVALYSVGRYVTNARWSAIGLGSAFALNAVGNLIAGSLVTDIGLGFVVLFLVWYIGRRIRIRGDYLRLLQERAAHLEGQQAAEARRAVAEERTRSCTTSWPTGSA